MNEVRYIEKNDIKRIREYFKYRNRIVMLNMMNIGINIAIRISDLHKLRFEQIPKSGIFNIKEQKTGKRKVIVFNEACIKAVDDLKKFYKSLGYSTKDGYLFKSLDRVNVKNHKDVPITPYSTGRHLREAKEFLNIEYAIGTHSFRKTWGHYYYVETKDIGFIMKALNHSSVGTTLRYIGIEQEYMNEAYRNFIL